MHAHRTLLHHPLLPITLVTAATVIGVVACGGDDALEAGDLDGRTFVATELSGGTIVDGSEIVISFEDDRVVVMAGCNTQNGGYTVDDGTLVVDALAATQMACDEPLMAQDTLVADLLAAGPTIELDGDQLTLGSPATTLTLTER